MGSLDNGLIQISQWPLPFAIYIDCQVGKATWECIMCFYKHPEHQMSRVGVGLVLGGGRSVGEWVIVSWGGEMRRAQIIGSSFHDMWQRGDDWCLTFRRDLRICSAIHCHKINKWKPNGWVVFTYCNIIASNIRSSTKCIMVWFDNVVNLVQCCRILYWLSNL